MRITNVKVYPVNEERLKGYATIVFDDCFVVHDVKIIQGPSGLFVAMPSKRTKNGTYRDTAHPLNRDTRLMIEKAVLDRFESEIASDGHAAGIEDPDQLQRRQLSN